GGISRRNLWAFCTIFGTFTNDCGRWLKRYGLSERIIMADQLHDWKELAAQLRVDSIRCTTAAGSGHPTSGMSAADLMAVLLSKYLRFDWSNPRHPNNDRLVFSKGHA